MQAIPDQSERHDVSAPRSAKHLSIGGLTVRYVAALTLIAALSVIGQLFVQSALSRQRQDSHLLNLAGRQRTLSQKLTKSALALARKSTPTERAAQRLELEDTLELWTKTHRGLQEGDAEQGLTGNDSSRMAGRFAELEPHHQAMIQATHTLLYGDASQFSAALTTLLDAEKRYLPGMEAIVLRYEEEAKARVSTLVRIEIALLCLTLGVLLLEACFVFQPAIRQIQKTLTETREAQTHIRTQYAALEHHNQELREQQAQLEDRQVSLEAMNESLAEMQEQMQGAIRRFSELFQGLPTACFTHDDAGCIMEWNRACELLYGFSADTVMQHTVGEFFASRRPDESVQEALELVFAGQGCENREWVYTKENGECVHLLCSMIPMRDPDGRVLGGICATIDISERQESEEIIRTSEAQFRAAIEGSMDAFFLMQCLTNENGDIEDFQIVDLNTRAEIFATRTRERLLGGRMRQHFPKTLIRDFFEGSVDVALTQEAMEAEHSYASETGSIHWLRYQIVPVGEGVAVTLRDITAQKNQEELIEQQFMEVNEARLQLELQAEELRVANQRLEALATIDGLTGLKNHRAFQEFFEQEFQRALRYDTSLSLVMLDVDHFKQYNDTFGHPAGDEVLKQVAQILKQSLRTTDLAVRYGGEEFVLVLPNTDAQRAQILAERVRKRIADAAWEKRAVTASFGISTFSQPILTNAEMVSLADQALYYSKKHGRNRVTHCQTMAETVDLTFSIEPAVTEGTSVPTKPSSAELAAELSQVYDATIEGWSRFLDLRDQETEGHTERVTEMTLRLAKRLGMTEEELVYVRWGALLHDIGKMGIPDNILLKPGPLTEDEWIIMRRHPGYAYKMLAPIAFLQPALDIPYCHHEKWDGTGYPRGLKGEQIPLSARIFAIVDVWDALRSDRPYREGWSEERVQKHLHEQAGTHFEPEIVQVFLTMLQEEARQAA